MAAEDYHADFFDYPRGHTLLDPVDIFDEEPDAHELRKELFRELEELDAMEKKRTIKSMPSKLRTATPESREKQLLKANKFYVGSPTALTRGWGHETLDLAVKHAEQVLDEKEGEVEFTFVVQIVRVVRRKRMPAVVEKV